MYLPNCIVKFYTSLTIYNPHVVFNNLSQAVFQSFNKLTHDFSHINQYCTFKASQIKDKFLLINFRFSIKNYSLDQQWDCLELLDLFPSNAKQQELYEAISLRGRSYGHAKAFKVGLQKLPEENRNTCFLKVSALVTDQMAPEVISGVLSLLQIIPVLDITEELVKDFFGISKDNYSNKRNSISELRDIIEKYSPVQRAPLLKLISAENHIPHKIDILKILTVIPYDKITQRVVNSFIVISKNAAPFDIEELKDEISQLVEIKRLDILETIYKLLFHLETIRFQETIRLEGNTNVFCLIEVLKEVKINFCKTFFHDISHRLPELIRAQEILLPRDDNTYDNKDGFLKLKYLMDNIGKTYKWGELEVAPPSDLIEFYSHRFIYFKSELKGHISLKLIQKFTSSIPLEDEPQKIEKYLKENYLFRTEIPLMLRKLSEENLNTFLNAVNTIETAELNKISVSDMVLILQVMEKTQSKDISKEHILSIASLIKCKISDVLLNYGSDVEAINNLKLYMLNFSTSNYNWVHLVFGRVDSLSPKQFNFLSKILSYDLRWHLDKSLEIKQRYIEDIIKLLKMIPNFSGSKSSIGNIARLLQYTSNSTILIKKARKRNPEANLEACINYAVRHWELLASTLNFSVSEDFYYFVELCILIPIHEQNHHFINVLHYLKKCKIELFMINKVLKKVPISERGKILKSLLKLDLNIRSDVEGSPDDGGNLIRKTILFFKTSGLIKILWKFGTGDLGLGIAAKYIQKDQVITKREITPERTRDYDYPLDNLVSRCCNKIFESMDFCMLLPKFEESQDFNNMLPYLHKSKDELSLIYQDLKKVPSKERIKNLLFY